MAEAAGTARRREQLPGWAMPVAGALLGFLAYLLTFPLDAVFAGADAFSIEPDQKQHVTAIRYFAWDQWRWPLFLAQPMGAPEGSIIVFSDGLPLFSLLVRLLRDVAFVPDSNFLALWLALCYALQGASAVVALRLAGEVRPAVLLLGAILALTLPSFIQRFGHAPLCAQGLILLALGLYFGGRRSGEAGRMLAWGLLLCWVTLLVNAYLYVMVSALFGALWLAALAERTLRPGRAALLLALHLGVSWLIMWSGGYLEGDGIGSGYGRYSWNPLSLVLPQQSYLFPDWPLVDATGGQYEGFSYLGLGLLLAVAAALLASGRRFPAALRRHWALLLAVLALLLLALSTRIYVGQTLLFDLGEAPQLLGTLRSAGRMVWVLLYLLLIAAVLTLPRRWGRRGVLALAAAALLQLLDSQAYRDGVERRLAATPSVPIPAEAWTPLLSGRDLVEVYPDFACAGDNATRTLVNETVYRASAVLTPASTAYSARPQERNCSRHPAEGLFFRTLEPDRLLVVLGRRDNLARFAVSSVGVREADQLCREFRFGIACTHHWPDLAAIAGNFKPQAARGADLFPALRLGGGFRPSLTGEVARLLGPGWVESEAGTFTKDGVGWLVVRPERIPPAGVEIAVQLQLPPLPGVIEQELWVTVNGKELGRWQQAPAEAPFTATLRLGASTPTADGLLLIGLHNESPVPVSDDEVMLGLRVDRVAITAR